MLFVGLLPDVLSGLFVVLDMIWTGNCSSPKRKRVGRELESGGA